MAAGNELSTGVVFLVSYQDQFINALSPCLHKRENGNLFINLSMASWKNLHVITFISEKISS